ncbi:MAG: hypothetical protein O2807_03715 [bacterium]|nr:hypothetical protein [bacterium]
MSYAQIDNYCDFFKEKIDEISSLGIDPLYKKILIVTIIDTLSIPRFPNRNNRYRFTKIIETCGQWKNATRICLPQLLLNLRNEPATLGGSLESEVARRIGSWSSGRIYGIDVVDPWLTGIVSSATTTQEEKCILNNSQSNLFYLYRNHIVHEFREPGQSIPVFGNPNPHYHMHTVIGGPTTWELVYPVEFIILITKNILDSLKIYLYGHYLDPYQFYNFGSLWSRR